MKWLGLAAVREEPPPALAAWVNARADVNGRSIGATEERAAAQIWRFLLWPEHPPCQIDNVRQDLRRNDVVSASVGRHEPSGLLRPRRAQIVWDSGGIADHHQS